MLLVLWEYRVRAGHLDEFETLYRPDGPWTALLRRSPAFVSTTLWHDSRDRQRYLVADRWTSATVYDEFVRETQAEIATLTARSRPYWEREAELGRFDLEE